MLFTDEVVLITGANRGIGRGIALLFAREGARIAVTGRSKEKCDQVTAEIIAEGGRAHSFVLDVTKDDEVFEAVRQILATWGQIDILVNNAAVMNYDIPVWKTSVENWDDMMRVNLRGVFLCCHAVIPHMMEREKGIIINIGSIVARRAGGDAGAYATTKWGLLGYTTSLARSVRAHGIRVNGVNPGGVDTDMLRAHGREIRPDMTTPEELAQAVLFLAAQAPPDMTGQFIDVFGSL